MTYLKTWKGYKNYGFCTSLLILKMFYAFKQYQEKHILPNPLQISYEQVMIGGTNFEYTAFLNFKMT